MEECQMHLNDSFLLGFRFAHLLLALDRFLARFIPLFLLLKSLNVHSLCLWAPWSPIRHSKGLWSPLRLFVLLFRSSAILLSILSSDWATSRPRIRSQIRFRERHGWFALNILNIVLDLLLLVGQFGDLSLELPRLPTGRRIIRLLPFLVLILFGRLPDFEESAPPLALLARSLFPLFLGFVATVRPSWTQRILRCAGGFLQPLESGHSGWN